MFSPFRKQRACSAPSGEGGLLRDFWLAVYTAGSALGSQAQSPPTLSRSQAAGSGQPG